MAADGHYRAAGRSERVRERGECLHVAVLFVMLSSLFAGFFLRVSWISLGGFLFLGAYEKASQTINSLVSS